MNKLLIFLFSLLAVSLEAATITNWGAQLPTAAPAGGDVILMQKGGVTYYFTPNQLASSLLTNVNSAVGPSHSVPFNSNGVMRGSADFVFTNGSLVVNSNVITPNNILYWGADPTGARDCTAALSNAMAYAYAKGGGQIDIPVGIYAISNRIVLPNNGVAVSPPYPYSRQPPITLNGFGDGRNGQRVPPSNSLSGSILMLRFPGTNQHDAKFSTFGLGLFRVKNLTLWDDSGATNDFIYTTGTTLEIKNNWFYGSKSQTNCDQDCIILGGTFGTNVTLNSPDSSYQGYSTVIEQNMFDKLRRCIYARAYVNHPVIRENHFEQNCGNILPQGAAIEFDGTSNDGQQNGEGVIAFNRFQMAGYRYGIKLTNCHSLLITGNDVEDATLSVNAGFIWFSSNSYDHLVISTYAPSGGSMGHTNHFTDLTVDDTTLGRNTILNTLDTTPSTFLPRGITSFGNSLFKKITQFKTPFIATSLNSKPAPDVYYVSEYFDGTSSVSNIWAWTSTLDGTTAPENKFILNQYGSPGLARLQLGTNIYVGINTNTPAERLHVANGNIGLETGAFVRWANGNNRISFDGAALQIYVNNRIQQRITPAGVTIALDASPMSQLDVNGGMSVGVGYAGTSAAPTNGVIIKGVVGIGTTTPATGSSLDVTGAVYAASYYATGDVSALTFTDRSRSPDTLEDSYAIVQSIQTINGHVDHGKLHALAWGTKKNEHGVEPDHTKRDLGMVVSAQGIVIQDLLRRLEALEKPRR